MKQNIKTIIIATGGILGISLSVFFLTFVVLAWTGPQHTPPTCGEGEVGCEEVLHTGASAQEKEGGLLLNTGGAEYGFIVENGNVGIGTTTPSVKLQIVSEDTTIADFISTSSTAGGITLGDNETTVHPYLAAYDNVFNLLTGGSRRITVLENGNVGIGTTIPTQKLDVIGTVSANDFSGLDNSVVMISAFARIGSTASTTWTATASCPDGYKIVLWGALKSTQYWGGGMTHWYSDCTQSGNGIQASVYTQKGYVGHGHSCFGLCVKE